MGPLERERERERESCIQSVRLEYDGNVSIASDEVGVSFFISIFMSFATSLTVAGGGGTFSKSSVDLGERLLLESGPL